MSDDGGPAFPAADMRIHGTYGMTLRDWFAGQALMGLCQRYPGSAADRIALMAYEQADAMLAARKEPTP